MRITALALTVASFATIAMVAPANAQYCEGTVRGLSAHYNPDTGSGFLAVRSKPRASSHQRGELFNGDTVEIFNRKGNWYKVAANDGSSEGWAHARWIHNDCNY